MKPLTIARKPVVGESIEIAQFEIGKDEGSFYSGKVSAVEDNFVLLELEGPPDQWGDPRRLWVPSGLLVRYEPATIIGYSHKDFSLRPCF